MRTRWVILAITISLATGLVLGGVAVAGLLLRPASTSARQYREQAERADRELAIALTDYQRIRGELGDRMVELEDALGRERAISAAAVARVSRTESRARQLAERLGSLARASGEGDKALAGIRTEVAAGLGELAALGRLLASGP